MKILQVHNRYKFKGGEDVVCDQEYELLQNRGVEVDRFIVDNKEQLDNIWALAKLVVTTHYSRKSRDVIYQKLQESSYNILHVHNFFPLLTPSIFDASTELGVPSVLTLHNYRLLYPNGLLLNEGKIDERTIAGSAYRCVPDAVYRGSVFQTAVVAHMIEYHRRQGTWNNKVTRFIALSKFARSKFIEGGLPAEKIEVKPNFVEDHLEKTKSGEINLDRQQFYLYVGRISSEKGIETLLQAWKRLPEEIPLYIIGEGPLAERLQKIYRSHDNIRWFGAQPREYIFEYLKHARGLIFPSECYEGSPLTILEAFSMGTPVISSDIGSQAEIVDGEINGLQFETGNAEDLAETIINLDRDKKMLDSLSNHARKSYLDKYTPEKNVERLMTIYRQAGKSLGYDIEA